MSGQEDDIFDGCCPLCITPFTDQDKQFRPCSTCSFRLCLWCWHTIVTLAQSEYQLGTCPQCRQPYDLETIRKQSVHLNAKPRASRKATSVRAPLADVVLNDKRVVAVRNIPAFLMEVHSKPATVEDRMDVIGEHFLFGQYGRIMGAVVTRGTTVSTEGQSSEVYHAVIRYSTSEEAARCVRASDRATLGGEVLRVFLIPTRYCSSFLLKIPCTKKMCIELHQEVTDRSLVVKALHASTLPLMGVAPGGDAGDSKSCAFSEEAITQRAESWITSRLEGLKRIFIPADTNSPWTGESPHQNNSMTTPLRSDSSVYLGFSPQTPDGSTTPSTVVISTSSAPLTLGEVLEAQKVTQEQRRKLLREKVGRNSKVVPDTERDVTLAKCVRAMPPKIPSYALELSLPPPTRRK